MALLSSVSSLLPFSYGATRLSSKASLASRTSGFNLSSRWNSTRNAPRVLYLSRAMTSNGGYSEVSENETAPRTLNSTFEKARSYCLIPLLDTVIKKISHWFNQYRKDSVAGTSRHKLVPLVENNMHDWWEIAEKLKVTELHYFMLEYNVIDVDGKSYSVNLSTKSCTCRFFDIERYPCMHGLVAFIYFLKLPNKPCELDLHELCTRYYWTESWAMAYCRTIYLVPDKTQWNVPDHIKELQILPSDKKKKKGRRRVNRFPSVGEQRRKRSQNKRRPKQGLQWWIFGDETAV